MPALQNKRKRRVSRDDKSLAGLTTKLAAGAGGLGGLAFLVGEEVGVGTLEIVDVAVIEVPDASGNFVEKGVGVGDEEDGAFVFFQRDVGGVCGFWIEVVGWLGEGEDCG